MLAYGDVVQTTTVFRPSFRKVRVSAFADKVTLEYDGVVPFCRYIEVLSENSLAIARPVPPPVTAPTCRVYADVLAKLSLWLVVSTNAEMPDAFSAALSWEMASIGRDTARAGRSPLPQASSCRFGT